MRLIAAWLLTVAAMVFAMVVLGGLTRLTHSGLSMVEWRPLTGWLPPFSHAAWEAEFRAYQQYPEFLKLNSGMTLSEFQEIYWLEFLHRLWGRLIGVVFFVPFLFFVVSGWVRGRLAVGCAVLFLLGAMQGALGWYMVSSGLVDRPDVSPYRLTAHLTMALLIYAALIWTAFDLLRGRRAAAPVGWPAWPALTVAGFVFVTIAAGGFVAGTDAGYQYNTFPLMEGRLFPEGAFPLTPLWRNLFETVPLVQFNHRVLAMLTLGAIVAFRLTLRRAAASAAGRRAANFLTVWVFVQVSLGIATLVLYMPVALAAFHQASAVVLWTAAVWTVFEVRRPVRPPLTVATWPIERELGARMRKGAEPG